MSHKELIDKLKAHLKSVELSASDLYKVQLRKLIERLEKGEIPDEELIRDLQSLGFHDIAAEIRRGMYI